MRSQSSRGEGLPRLLVCVGEYVAGAGQTRVVQNELYGMRDRYEVTLVAPRIRQEVPESISIEVISMCSFKAILRFWGLVQSADVVHLHDSLAYMAVAVAAAREKCVITCHGIAPPAIRRGMWQKIKGYITLLLYPSLYRRAENVVTYSEFLLCWLCKRGTNNAKVIPLGVSFRCLERTIQPSEQRLIYIGEISWRKGIDLLVQGIAQCPESVTLDVVGSGDLKWLSDMIKQYDLLNRIRVWGMVSDKELLDLMDKAFAVVSFSRWEGFGLPIIEGFARGLPAIVARGSAMEEIVGRVGAGRSVVSPIALADAISYIAEHWGVLSRLASETAAVMRWEDVWVSYDKLFQEILLAGG